ncbi:MAG: hypothetical protein JWN62_2124 [Acidimicrobiales bacterium]|nr:hypothetical protein [Acidimicrobiales bacterium]
MALYIPVSTRRRNAALVAIATLLAGLLVGFLIGRTSAVTAEEAARDVRSKGDTLGTRIEALSIEYKQAIDGGADSIQAGVLDALDLVLADTDALVGEAPWIGPGQVTALHDAISAVRTAATDKVPVTDFENVSAVTAKTIRDTFGVAT